MTSAAPPDAARRAGAGTLAVVIGFGAVFALAQGLTYPLLAFILDAKGVSPTLIGLNTAMTPLGILVSAPLIPRLAARFGAGRLALGSALALAGLLLLIGAVQSLAVWFPARFLIGVAANGIYVPAETWTNALAPPDKRGRVLGIFSSVLSLGFAAGPFILVAVGTEGWAPFLIGAAGALTVAAALSLVLAKLPPLGEAAISFWGFLPLAPFLLLIVVVVSAHEQAALSLLPVYGLAKGIAAPVMAAAVGALIIGNIFLQMPIGWLADAWSRLGTLVLLSMLTIVGAALLPFLIGSDVLLWPFLAIWGAAAYGVYTVALIELGDRFSGGELLAGNAAFAAMWGVGGALGPTLGGGAMDALGPDGLPLVFGLLYAALLMGALAARTARPSRAP